MTADGSPGAIFWRAIQRGNVIMAESVAREFDVVPLDYALALTHLYADKHDRRFERAALRYLERYMVESKPSLRDLADVAGTLAQRLPR